MCFIYRSEEDEGFPAVAVERLLLERIWEQEPTPPGESPVSFLPLCIIANLFLFTDLTVVRGIYYVFKPFGVKCSMFSSTKTKLMIKVLSGKFTSLFKLTTYIFLTLF